MLVSDGVELEVDTIPYTMGVYLCALDCTSGSQGRRDAILLQKLDAPRQYARILSGSDSIVSVSKERLEHGPTWTRRRLYVHNELRHPPMKLVRGIHVRDIDLLRQYRSSHGKIRILSRLDGSVNVSDACSMVQLPANEWGTTGMIYFPRDQSNFRHWSVRWIKLGFDDEFCPVIRLGYAQMITDEVSLTTKSPPRYGTAAYEDIWDSCWIWEEPDRMTKTETIYESEDTPSEVRRREYTSEEYFYYRGFEQHEAGPTRGIEFCKRYLGLRVELGLKDLPTQGLARHPSAPGPGPWKVWTLDIEQVRDFAKENQNLKLFEAGCAAGSGIVLGTWGAYIYTKNKQKQRKDEDLAQVDAESRAARPNRTSASSAAPQW